MRKPLFGAIAGAALAVAVVVGSTGIAQAANVDTSRISQTITGVGSDTLYEVQSDLDELYNEAVGCAIIPSAGITFVNYQQTCFDPNDTTGTVPGDPGTLPYGGNIVVKGNLYHDRAVEAYPVGSGSGTKVLSQFTLGNPAVSSDFARASSKQTYAVANFQQYGVAYGRDGAAFWVGRNNKLVAHTKAGVPTPNATLPRLKGAFIGTGSGKCLINWSKSKANSIGTAQGNPGAGSIDIFATQAGSGSGKDFLQKIDPANAATYTDASALQNCVPAKYKDGNPNNGEHVLVENQARPICSAEGREEVLPVLGAVPVCLPSLRPEQGGHRDLRRAPRVGRRDQADHRVDDAGVGPEGIPDGVLPVRLLPAPEPAAVGGVHGARWVGGRRRREPQRPEHLDRELRPHGASGGHARLPGAQQGVPLPDRLGGQPPDREELSDRDRREAES